MSVASSFTFYTYSPEFARDQPGSCDSGMGRAFFDSAENARDAVLEVREAILRDPEDRWTAVRLERIETFPVTKETLLALLNNGVGAIVHHYEVIDTIQGD